MEGGENRTPFLECFHVLHVVVRRPIFPASEEDPNPFEGQGTNDRVKFFTFGCVVIDIVASPLALGDREAGKPAARSSVKFWGGVPRIKPLGFAPSFWLPPRYR